MRLVLRIVVLAGVLVAGVLPGAGQPPADRAAVPLYTPPLITPAEAGATGIAPEVSVRMTIDAAGRVSDVVIEKIVPSTELDGHFEKATRETLLSWRYAPAEEQGHPVSVERRWTIRYTEIGKQETERTPAMQWRRMARSEQESRDYRVYLLSLPLEKRTEMLTRLGAAAHKHLKPGGIVKSSSPRFVVYCDAPDKTIAGTVANNLEATFNVLSGLLQPWVVSYPEPYRVVVFVYRYKSSFQALKREIRGIEWSVGFYNPLGLVAFHLEMPSTESLMSIMLHEATHAYLDRYVARSGVGLPRWLDEGLSQYIGDSRIKKKQLVPGKIRNAEMYSGWWGMRPGESSSRVTLAEIKQAIKKGKLMSLERMVSAESDEFYGDERERYYALAWLLIHFLRHGEEDWAEERFPRLVLYIAEGYTPKRALTEVYGAPDDLEPRFRDYVLKF